MDRRSFLSLFGAAAIGATLDPEKLLWIPGQKTIFLPSATSFDMIRDYDISTDQFPCRSDVLYGFATLRPEWAIRFHGYQ